MAEAVKLQEEVLASHRDLKGYMAEWHESMESLMKQGRDVEGAAQVSGAWLSRLGFHDRHPGRAGWRFSRADVVPARWRHRLIVS